MITKGKNSSPAAFVPTLLGIWQPCIGWLRLYFTCLIIFLLLPSTFVYGEDLANTTAAKAERSCSKVLASSKLNDYSRSFVGLVEAALKNGLLSNEDIKDVLSSPEPINPIRGKGSVQAEAFREGFEILLSKPSALNWPVIVEQMAKTSSKRASDEEVEAEESRTTKLTFDPHISHRFKTKGRVESEPLYIKLKNGTEYIAVGTTQNQLYLFNLKTPDIPIIIPTNKVVRTKPIFFESRDGREFLAFGTDHNSSKELQIIYLLDLSKPQRDPKAIEIQNSKLETLSFNPSPTGKEYLSLGSIRETGSKGIIQVRKASLTITSEILRIDINNFTQSLSTPLFEGPWENYLNILLSDGTPLKVVSNLEHIFLVDPSQPEQAIKIPTGQKGGEVSSNLSSGRPQNQSLFHFRIDNKVDHLALGLIHDGAKIFELKNPYKEPLHILKGERLLPDPFQYFFTIDNRNILSLLSEYDTTHFFDLADPENPEVFYPTYPTAARGEYLFSPDQKEYLLYSGTLNKVVLANIKDKYDSSVLREASTNWLAAPPSAIIDSFGRRIIYFYDRSEITIIDLEDPSNPRKLPLLNFGPASRENLLALGKLGQKQNIFFAIDGEDLVQIDLYKGRKSKELR